MCICHQKPIFWKVDIYSYFLYICFPIWSKSTCPHMACLSHSTDREVALMMLMTYLSYMLAEVSFAFRYFFIAFKDKSTLMLIIILFWAVAAIRLEWYSHCVLLWDCDVSLHLAQRNREHKNHYQVLKSQVFTTFCSKTLFCSSFFLINDRHTFWNIVISCGDIYFLVRGNGCTGHWQVENSER